MCKNDPFEDEIVPPAEKARKELMRRISRQQVKRYYSKAQCLNSGEKKNLGITLKTIANTVDEFKRSFTASQKVFKINRRRQIGSVAHISVDNEIKTLDEKRRQSMTLSRLSITQDLEESIKMVFDENKLPIITVNPLPNNSASALHEGVPTALTMPKIKRRIKTAPAYARRTSDTAVIPSQNEIKFDPLHLLERVETSDGLSKIRDKLARKDSSSADSAAAHWKRTRADYPQYLALDSLEEKRIRANNKQQMVERWKKFHAGSDDRCSALVKKWIDDERYNFVK